MSELCPSFVKTLQTTVDKIRYVARASVRSRSEGLGCAMVIPITRLSQPASANSVRWAGEMLRKKTSGQTSRGESARRTEITLETHELLIARKPRRTFLIYCAKCGETVQMMTAEHAAKLAGASLRSIFRQVETGGVHLLEMPDGLSLICIKSLRND